MITMMLSLFTLVCSYHLYTTITRMYGRPSVRPKPIKPITCKRDTTKNTTWVWLMIGLVVFYVLIIVCLCGGLFTAMKLGG